jgi:endonuclease-3
MMKIILDYLDELYPNPKPELKYNNDFEFLIAVVLSAQTTDKKVNKVTEVLFDKYNIDTLNTAKIEDLEYILKPLGMSIKKAIYIKSITNTIIEKYNYKIPNNREKLMTLSGVGRKTANVVLSHLYQIPYIAVDTHVNRISKRLNIAKEEDDVLKVEERLYKVIPKDIYLKIHLQLVLFGRYKCKAIKPECNECKLKGICKYYKKTR